MSPDETRALYEATGPGSGLPGVYLLGSLCYRGEQIAVVRQQQRALNLVYALGQGGALARPGAKLCVIGAGAAGLTAAAFALSEGISVTVLECRKPLWNLRGCKTRWLHPNLFPKWPKEGWDVTSTAFPVMNWYADYADRVGELLLAKFRSHLDASAARGRVVDLVDEHSVVLGGGPSVTWKRNSIGAGLQTEAFDAVIVAVGFGSEAPQRDAAASVYWLDDSLERSNPRHGITRYLVSGTGDGGLTDLLRLRIDEFRHHHLRDLLRRISPRVTDAIMTCEEAHRQQYLRCQNDRDREECDEALSDRLRAIARDPTLRDIFPKLRNDSTVVLTARSAAPFSIGGQWRVSRFLAACLLEQDYEGDVSAKVERTRYFASGAQGTRVFARTGYDGQAPTRFDVMHGNHEVVVDSVVYRHGTVPVIRSLLARSAVSESTMQAIEERWRKAWVRHENTTDELSWPTENRDNAKRARAVLIGAISPGRTPIGLLSRLMAQLERLRRIEPRKFGQPLRVDLMTDELAWMVTPIDARLEVKRGGPWELSGAHSEDDLVNAAHWIDTSLDPEDESFWISRHAHLEHHWVLPRFEWLPIPREDALLVNTCVAQRWGKLQLVYRGELPDPLPPPPAAPHQFEVYDDVAGARRVARFAAGDSAAGADGRRLACELGCTHLLEPDGVFTPLKN